MGIFAGFSAISVHELELIGQLFLFFLFGLACAWYGQWQTVSVVAYLLPVWALCFTTLGLVGTILTASSVAGTAGMDVFHSIGGAMVPNAVGVACMAWLQTLGYFSASERV